MMKQIIIMVLFWVIPLLVNAQKDVNKHNDGGIQFTSAKNWQEVLSLAKKENKPIFIDVYATWCGPCRMMDNEVFIDKQVGDYVNTNFIAVKIQMDSTKNDNEYVRGWYTDTYKWKQYLTAFPTFLFFAADGKYSGKEEGYFKPQDFILVLKKVIDPNESYLSQIKTFNQEGLSKEKLIKLAFWAQRNKDSIALKIAKIYKIKYIDPTEIDSILNPETARFIGEFLELFSFNDKIISYIYNNQELADKKFNRWLDYSKNITDEIIVRDYVNSFIQPNDVPTKVTPDWDALEISVAKAFDKITAKRLILNPKINWAYTHKQYEEAARLELERIEKYGMDTTGIGRVMLNNLMYDVVFKQVKDTKLLKKAASVMKKVVDLDHLDSHERLDTYASLLYKAGEKQKAIAMEKQALVLVKKKNNLAVIKFYEDVINKMKKDIPIWEGQ